jgi:hypothetical protein
MATRQSSTGTGFPWVWILVPIIGNALRGAREVGRHRPDSDLLVVVLVSAIVVLAMLGLIKAAFASNRDGPRGRHEDRPIHLDPLWDDQLDRYPR